ncbi:unnamed protein product [Hymenolepis diminuta]|uniref:Uncharacterized protein n=1 Tax=Hymenolepis diminuta TaxID=6216 RepID=A0A3P6ZSK5_HYMDI|nr:unnamed protein product [Hymenolepis diminuta]
MIGALYSLVGLALLSMCFELMKEEFVDKVRWIGRSLRIVTKTENDEMEVVEEIREGGDFDKETTGGELRPDSHHEISSTADDLGLFESVGVVSSTKSNGCYDYCHSKDLGNSSPKMKKPVCVLRKHKGHCSVRSRTAKQQMSKRNASTRGIENDINLVEDGELEIATVDSYFGGEDNEAFGGDMDYDDKGMGDNKSIKKP